MKDSARSPANPATPREPAGGMPGLPLVAASRQLLKARAHALRPVVMIGSAALTDPLVAEVNRALDHHGLVKIRVLGADRDERAGLLEELCGRTGAAPVQHLGRMLTLYRPLTPAPQAEPPGERRGSKTIAGRGAAGKTRQAPRGAVRREQADRPRRSGRR